MINSLGFTGSRYGMSTEQKATFKSLLYELTNDGHTIKEFHHGGCVGADSNAHYFVRVLMPGCHIVIHQGPANKTEFKSWVRGDTMLAPKAFLARNIDIIDASDLMIATPLEEAEPVRGGGTWHTVRNARRLNRPLKIIWPNGDTTCTPTT